MTIDVSNPKTVLETAVGNPGATIVELIAALRASQAENARLREALRHIRQEAIRIADAAALAQEPKT